MIIDTTIADAVASALLSENEANTRKHSGNLMASMLSMPTLWQVLSSINIPSEPFDAYTLAKFKRGRDVEQAIVPFIPDVIATQKEIIINKTKGIADVIVDTKNYKYQCGIMPIEIKSVTNAKFKRISSQGADIGHRMQGGYYAIGEKADNYGILYVASDDYRTLLMVFNTSDIERQVRLEMNEYEEIIKTKRIPPFVKKLDWHENPKYVKYTEWNNLNSEQILEKLQTEFPEHYQFFMSL